jgi:hypothetical protein
MVSTAKPIRYPRQVNAFHKHDNLPAVSLQEFGKQFVCLIRWTNKDEKCGSLPRLALTKTSSLNLRATCIE